MMLSANNFAIKSLISAAADRVSGWQSPPFDAEKVHAKLESARDEVETCMTEVDLRLDKARILSRGKPLEETRKLAHLRAPAGAAYNAVRSVVDQALKCTADGFRAQGKSTGQAISTIDEIQAILLREISQVDLKVSAYAESIPQNDK